MTGENTMVTKASKWWEAVDVGITSSERKRIEGQGYKLGRWSYRRKYVCPLCGKKGATETFRDFSVIKEGNILPQMTILCSGCKLQLEDEPEHLAKMMVLAKQEWGNRRPRRRITTDYMARLVVSKHMMGAKAPEWPKIERLDCGGILGWGRIDGGTPDDQAVSAVYGTVAEASATPPEQHRKFAYSQLVQALGHVPSMLLHDVTTDTTTSKMTPPKPHRSED